MPSSKILAVTERNFTKFNPLRKLFEHYFYSRFCDSLPNRFIADIVQALTDGIVRIWTVSYFVKKAYKSYLDMGIIEIVIEAFKGFYIPLV